jgi:protein disulfide isomerase
MLTLASLRVLAVVLAVVLTTPRAAGNVIPLHDDDFAAALKDVPQAFVEFYAPWCGHCKKLEPEYNKAANFFSGSDVVKFFKVDATVEKQLSKEYAIDGFPTIIHFTNYSAGELMTYEGDRTAAAIKTYLIEQIPSLKHANVIELTAEKNNLRSFLTLKDAAAIGFFPNKECPEFAAFLKAAEYEEVPYAYTFEASVAADAGITGKDRGIAVLVRSGEVFNFDGELTNSAHIDSFVIHRQFGSVVRYSQRVHKKLFEGAITNQLVLFLKDVNGDSPKFADTIKQNEKLKDLFYATAKNYTEKHGFATAVPRFVIVRVNKFLLEEDYHYIYELGHKCNIRKEEDFPSLCYFETGDRSEDSAKPPVKKFRREAATIQAGADFLAYIRKCQGRDEPEIIQSQLPPPSESEKKLALKTLVGETFETRVFDRWKNKNVLVFLFAPWCKASRATMPEVQKLANEMSSVRNMVVAKYDAHSNDPTTPAAKTDRFPKFRLFKANRKTKDEYVEYEGEKKTKHLSVLLKAWVEGHVLLPEALKADL